MATEVVMPQMGESIAEGTITKWLVAVGDTVERDEPLFEISTDKVDAEIPSPETGVLLEIRHQEGETVAVDEIVAMIGAAGEEVGATPKVEVAAADEPEPDPAPRQVEEAPTPAAPIPEAPAPEAPAPTPMASVPTPEPIDPERSGCSLERAHPHLLEPGGPQDGRGGGRRYRPAHRQWHPRPRDQGRYGALPGRRCAGCGPGARGAGCRLTAPAPPATLSPATGPIGVPSVPTPAPPPASVPATRQPGEFHVSAYLPSENVEIEPMSKIRQITAAHMAYSKATSAHVSTCFHMDMSRVAKIRNRAKNGFYASQGTKLSYMPFIFRAVANALKTNRKVNASIDGTNIVYKKDINLGMAVALDWGLIVPVIKNADQLSLVGLAKTANDLAARARNKKLSPDEVQAGTFTITNPGLYGSLWGTPIINQPQVAILGIGTIEKRPVVDTDAEGNDVISIKTMCYFTITYDHRLVDGSDADAFMNDVKHTLTSETWNELDPYL